MKLSPEIKLTIIGFVLMLAAIPLDLPILQYVDAHADCRPFYAAITDIGLGKWWVWPSGILFILGSALYTTKNLRHRILQAWLIVTQFFFTVAGAGLITDILKRIIARARPVEYLTHGVRGIFYWHEALHGEAKAHFVSMPSGHTTTVFAIAGALAFLLPRRYRTLRVIIYVIVCILAFSRIEVEAHYASDVIAGAMVGTWAAIWAQRSWMPLWERKVLKINPEF